MKLSICSVCSDEIVQKGASHTQYSKYLNLNLGLSKNTDIDFEWVVTCSKNPYPRKLYPNFETIELDQFFKKNHIDHNFQIKEDNSSGPWLWEGGVNLSTNAAYQSAWETKTMGINSIEHGVNLSHCLKHVSPDSEFVLLLDPDFYIIPPLHSIINFMEDKKLAFFGASYALSKAPVIRDFPVAFCLFINRKMIDISSLDLTIGYSDSIDGNIYPDVGYKIYSQYKENKEIYDFAIPTIDEKDPRFNASQPFKHTTKSVLTWANKIGRKPEEYWYGGEPFGLHVRAKMNAPEMPLDRKLGRMRQLNVVKEFVESLRKANNYTLRKYL